MRLRALAALAAIAIAAACGGSDGGSPITTPTTSKDTIFTIGIASFSPNQVTISKGSAVVFALGFDGTGHDVRFAAAAGAPADIPVVVRQNVLRTFSRDGELFVHLSDASSDDGRDHGSVDKHCHPERSEGSAVVRHSNRYFLSSASPWS